MVMEPTTTTTFSEHDGECKDYKGATDQQQQSRLPSVDHAQHTEEFWCQECSKRLAIIVCSECAMALCSRCSEAIHLVEEYKAHVLRSIEPQDWILFLRPSNVTACSVPVPPVGSLVANASGANAHATATTNRTTTTTEKNSSSNATCNTGTHVGESENEVKEVDEDADSDPSAEAVMHARFPMGIESSSFVNRSCASEPHVILPLGTHVLFQCPEVARWHGELSHALVVSDQVREKIDPETNQPLYFYRVLWFRGIERLPNGFYNSFLTLSTPFWPIVIRSSPSLLASCRTVFVAERLARNKWRRELMRQCQLQAFGQGHGQSYAHRTPKQTTPAAFPSVEIINEILEETEVILDDLDYAVPLTPAHDKEFFRAIAAGHWDWKQWLRQIGLSTYVSEEELLESDTTRTIEWHPSDRARFFLVNQRELVFQTTLSKHKLLAVMEHMLFVYEGYAWQRWKRLMLRERHRERKAMRHQMALRIQMWWVKILRKLKGADHVRTTFSRNLEMLDFYRRRELQCAKLKRMVAAKRVQQKRSALKRWATACGIFDPALRKRFEISASPKWHPSIGLVLPKLPRMFVSRKTDGSLAIEDIERYKFFRANHAGPTDVSYWVIRDRLLAGTYPDGAALRDARRIVSRTDAATSILLADVSTFICLATAKELEAVEIPLIAADQERELKVAKLGRVSSLKATRQESRLALVQAVAPSTPWRLERHLRLKHSELHSDLQKAVEISKRHVQLAQDELDDAHELEQRLQEQIRSLQRRYRLDDGQQYQLEKLQQQLQQTQDHIQLQISKLELGNENVTKNQQSLQHIRTMRFLHCPIPKDATLPPVELQSLLIQIEDLLRQQENIYLFSIDGHGRTGFLAALLLGRIYGITANEALERAQRLHDCQRCMHNVPSTRFTSSPQAQSQIQMVHQMLAPVDAIYRPIVEESDHGFRLQRSQQRGVLPTVFLAKDGFMISELPTERSRHEQFQEQIRLERVTKREVEAAFLRKQRKREASERHNMQQADIQPLPLPTN